MEGEGHLHYVPVKTSPIALKHVLLTLKVDLTVLPDYLIQILMI